MSGSPTRARRHRLEHAALSAVTAVVRRLPQSFATGLGHAIGALGYRLDARHRLAGVDRLNRHRPAQHALKDPGILT